MQDAMDFDKFITCNQESCPEYGIVFGGGNKNLLLVKAGQGGSARGYKDKYLKLAHEIRNAYGMSVVCSSTPDTEINQMEHAMQVLSKEGLLTADTRIYFVGFSKGASIGCLQGSTFPQIKRSGADSSFSSKAHAFWNDFIRTSIFLYGWIAPEKRKTGLVFSMP